MPIIRIRLLCLLFLLCGCSGISAATGRPESPLRLKTIVIDPGHGGKAVGCVSRDGKTYEKNIVLDVSRRLGRLIAEEFPEIKVIYTRTGDQDVGLSQRAEIANRNHADLFISIHVNSVGKGTSANGSETWVMGMHKSESNFEVCKAENSVIVLEEDYTSTYQGFEPDNPESYIIFSLLQNAHLEQSLELAAAVQHEFRKGPIRTDRGVKQGGLLVLWKCTMPAVLVELGFMSNPDDLRSLRSASGRQAMAEGIFRAVRNYKRSYEKGAGSLAAAPEKRFRIQLMASSRILEQDSREFKGLTGCERIRSGKLYKYTYGRYATEAEARKALPEIRKRFPEAFVIEVKP